MFSLRTQQIVSIEAAVTGYFSPFQTISTSSRASLFLVIALYHLDERIAVHYPAWICFDGVEHRSILLQF
jgi:hypothetical protein